MTNQKLNPEPAKKADRKQPVVGVSACLLGHSVRYDGGHKRQSFIVDQLTRHFLLEPQCPETAIGLGIPRPPIRLVGTDPERPRVVGVSDSSLDVTEALEKWSASAVRKLGHLDGFILKKDSPSCGMQRVKLYEPDANAAQRITSGVFARILQAKWPSLPVEEEGRLNDAVLRENFVNRIFVHQAWRQLIEHNLSASALIDFHARHKYLLMAHSNAAYQRLGRLLSNLRGVELDSVADAYFEELMSALSRRVTRKRHVNVLQHILGYLKRTIGPEDKQELTSCIERYRAEEIPLIVPITLFRHYFRVHPDPYIDNQVYLAPHPDILGLRNAL